MSAENPANFKLRRRWIAIRSCDQGNEPIQALIMLAVAALILLGIKQLAEPMTQETERAMASLVDARARMAGSQSALDELLTEIPLGNLPESHNPAASVGPQHPGEQQGKRIGDLLPGLTGSLADSTLRQVALMTATLSEDAYATAAKGPEGWDLLSRWDASFDFQASVYSKTQDGKQTIVVAYRGTDSLLDGAIDFWNAVFGSEQYLDAIKLARSIQRQNPQADMLLTGHSLGGGLAGYAAAMTGIPAVVHNAAGPSYPHLISSKLSQLVHRIQGGELNENVVHVNARRDPLTNSDAGRPWSDQVYAILHPDDLSSPLEIDEFQDLSRPHSISRLIEALRSTQPILRR